MVRDNRPKRKAKDDETSNSNNKGNSYNGVSSASGLPSSNTSGLRRSTRERQSKKQTSASPLSTRKSERLEQRKPTSIRVEKQVERSDNTLSPLTRSGRARSFLSSTLSSLNKTVKSSISSDLKHRKKINEKGVNKFEDKSATQRAGVVKKRNLDARSCRIPFKSPIKVETSDSLKRRKLRENSPSGICSSDCSGSGKGLDGHEDDMPLTKFVYMRKGKNAVSSPGSKDSDKSNREKSKEANIILEKDGDVKQRILDDNSPSDFCSSKKSCGNPREPKRKINIMQVVSSANASSSPSSEPGMNYSVEVTTSCSKTQRVDDTNKNKVFSSHITLSKKLPHGAVVRDENENEESSRKRKKMGYSNGDSSSLKVAPDSKEAEEAVSVKEGGTNALLSHQFGENGLHIMHTHRKDNSTALEVQVAVSEEKRKSDDARSNLYQFLKPKISLLCKTVQLPSHGDEPCEAHGKEMHDPTEGDAEKTSSMLPTEASSSGHTVVLPSDQLGDDVQANLPVARVSESASTTPLGHEQSVLPVSQNQLCWEPRLENPSCPNILSIDYSQPSIAFPVHPSGVPNGVRSGLNSVARGAAFSECSHSSTAVAASVISPLSYPLHNELGRLRKETDEATRIHKETALQLKSDREKEIDQIWMKYETKIRETDALYALKKQQLDTKYKKVLMNMILAEAFRSNCDDWEAYGAAPGVQDLPPSRTQQVFQSEKPAFRPSAFDSATSNDQLTVSQQNPEISVRNNNYSSTFSSIPSRPPQIGPSIPAAISQQMRSDICAPAPHLQYFRLPMPASSGGLSSVEFGPLNRQSVSSPFGSSHLIRELLTRPQQASARPPYQSSSRGWSHQPASVRASQACQNPLHSAMESLMGVSTRGGASQLSTLPPLSDLTRNYRTWDLSEFGTPANNILPSSSDQAAIPANVRPFHQGVAGEVVCLSDDD